MGELFDRYEGAPLKSKDIRIGEHYLEIFISETDEVLCYIGACTDLAKQPPSTFCSYPYNMQGKPSTDKKLAPHIRGFLRLQEGCIFLDDYVDNQFCEDRLYKKIKVGIHFPYPDSYYGIMRSYDDEDEDLTHAIFGLTCHELNAVLEAYAKSLGAYSPYLVYPKLTRSGKSDNYCEMADFWIPVKFPYISFGNSGYAYSHISLWGFIRHLQLLKAGQHNSVIESVLKQAGLDQQIMDRLFSLEGPYPSKEKATRSTFK